MADINSIKFSMTVKQIRHVDEELTSLYTDLRGQPNERARESIKDHIVYFRDEKEVLIEELKKVLNDLDYKKVKLSKSEV